MVCSPLVFKSWAGTNHPLLEARGLPTTGFARFTEHRGWREATAQRGKTTLQLLPSKSPSRRAKGRAGLLDTIRITIVLNRITGSNGTDGLYEIRVQVGSDSCRVSASSTKAT
ncbi:hypothetical protein [Hymenobacter polaris]|uniref:hypothetical protein n=1 Tax=Hymenobacter polaris TaxID=2682546 RepID=UPI001F507E31|nr:hypothetical protein [Hymenobacter polaris]